MCKLGIVADQVAVGHPAALCLYGCEIQALADTAIVPLWELQNLQ